MLQDFFEDFRHVNLKREADGFGGDIIEYTDGKKFRAGIGLKQSREKSIASKDGEKAEYAILFEKSTSLRQNDIVRRVKTGQIYRVTSDSVDLDTPERAKVAFTQVTAEVIRV